MNVEIRTETPIFLSGNICFEISVFCLCSVESTLCNLLLLTLPGGVAAHLLLPRLRGAGEREARAGDTNTLQRQLQPAGGGSG